MTDLTHEQARDFIQQSYLAEEERAALHRHLTACGDCRAYAAMHVRLLRELPLTDVRPQPTAAQAAAIRAAAGRPKSAPRLPRPVVSLAGLAALALLIVAAWLVVGAERSPLIDPLSPPTATLLAPFAPAMTATPSATPTTPAVTTPQAGAPATTPTPDPRGRFVIDTVPAPSLAGNTIGEPLQKEVVIYLPPSYDTGDRRYPVVYALLTDAFPLDRMGANLRTAMSAARQNAPTGEMIIVVPAWWTTLNTPSHFTDSPLFGNQQAFLTSDLVDYVDTHYRTLPDAASRGILGADLIGLSALMAAANDPGVFGAIYLVNPQVLAPGALEQSAYLSPTVRSAMIDLMEELLNLSPEAARSRIRSAMTAPARETGEGQRYTIAYALAFAATPDEAPRYFSYPYTDKEGPPNAAIMAQWENGLGNIPAKLQPRVAALRDLNIAISYIGSQGGPIAAQFEGPLYLSEQLTALGIPHRFKVLELSQFEDLAYEALPFFSENLASN